VMVGPRGAGKSQAIKSAALDRTGVILVTFSSTTTSVYAAVLGKRVRLPTTQMLMSTQLHDCFGLLRRGHYPFMVRPGLLWSLLKLIEVLRSMWPSL
jgi:hypothetical protein